MQFYFNTLDDTEQNKAIKYFSKSNDVLDSKVADALRKTQYFIRGFRDGTSKIIRHDSVSNVSKLLDPNFVMDGVTEIGVRPTASELFRLDERKDYPAVIGYEPNYEFKN